MAKDNFLKKYLSCAPVYLAMERAIECRLISKIEVKGPILDFGCGDGLFSSILFNRPPDMGLDISFEEIKAAAKRKTYRYTLTADLSQLPIKKECFTTIVCNSVLEHVADFKGALREARRVLNSSGKFILTVPTEDYEKFFLYARMLAGLGFRKLAGHYGRIFNKIFKHFHAYTAEQWIRIIEENGFKVRKIIHYLPERVITAHDLFLPLSLIAWLNKKIFNRWILWPALRINLAASLAWFLKKIYLYSGPDKGGYVLIEADCA